MKTFRCFDGNEYSSQKIIYLFLEATKHWYNSPENDLYACRLAVSTALNDFLTDGSYPSEPRLDYAVRKFESEWLII